MQTFQSKFDKIVYSFINDVGLPLNQAPMALSMGSSDFLNWWSQSQRSNTLTNKNIRSLAQYLHINEDSITSGLYDKTLIRRRLFDNPLALPDIYANNSLSYTRSSSHIIRYITITRGQLFADKFLQDLNISPLLYENLDNKINIKFFIDLLDQLLAYGFKQEDLDIIASLLLLGIKGTPLHLEYLKAKSYYDCYCTFAQTINQLESNFEYHADISKNQFRLITHFHFDKHFYSNDVKSFERLLRYRTLFLGWIPRLSNLEPALPKTEVIKTKNYIQEIHTVNLLEQDINQRGLKLVL